MNNNKFSRISTYFTLTFLLISSPVYSQNSNTVASHNAVKSDTAWNSHGYYRPMHIDLRLDTKDIPITNADYYFPDDLDVYNEEFYQPAEGEIIVTCANESLSCNP